MKSSGVIKSKPILQAIYEVHSFVKDSNDNRPITNQPEDIMVFAAMDANIIGQLVERL